MKGEPQFCPRGIAHCRAVIEICTQSSSSSSSNNCWLAVAVVLYANALPVSVRMSH